MPLLEEVTFFMVWFDPDLPVLRIHLNNTGPTARLTARRYRARISESIFLPPALWNLFYGEGENLMTVVSLANFYVC